MTAPAKQQASRGLSRSLASVAIAAVLAAFLFEWGRETLALHVVDESYALTGGSRVGMRVAGWLMFVAGPIAAVWAGRDFRRALAAARSPQPALARFAGRRRGRVGHRVRRPVTFWLTRIPVAVLIMLALAFAVPGGVVGGTPSDWAVLPGGIDFMAGVKWSLIATFAAGALVLVTEVVLLNEPKPWLSRLAGAVALLVPLAALALLIS